MNESLPLAGKIALVTGATSGIGRATAVELAVQGARVVLAVRNPSRGEDLRGEIRQRLGDDRAEVLSLDLSQLGSVRAAADTFRARHGHLDILVNNAGAVFDHRVLTLDGYEATLTVNHLGPFLLTTELLEPLRAAPGARIVNVASAAHAYGRINWDDLHFDRSSYSHSRAYAAAKLMTVLSTRKLATRLRGTSITANSLHPGRVASNFGGTLRGPFNSFVRTVGRLAGKSAEEGAQTSLHLAMSPSLEGISGRYFADGAEAAPAAQATDDEAARRLWRISERLISRWRTPSLVAA